MPNVEPYTCGTSCEPDPDQTQERGNRGCINQNAAPDDWAANVGWWVEVFRSGPTATTRHDASVPYHRMRRYSNDRYSCGIAPIGPLQAFQVMYT